jgi:anti-sigma regulatory factor (Ser/Thr protein kinase)
MVAEIDVRLAPESEIVTTARHALDRLADLLPPEKLEDVRLVVSELVTNSILHAGLSPDDQIPLTVTVSAGSVHGRVCDPGSGFEVPSEPCPRSDMRGGACPSSRRSRIAGESRGTATRVFGSRLIETSTSLTPVRACSSVLHFSRISVT